MADSADSRTLYVSIKMRMVQHINHVFAAIMLVFVAAASLAKGHHIAWAAIELLVAATLIGSVVREVHHKRTAEPSEQLHHHLGWIEIFSGIFVAVEAYARTHGTSKSTAFVAVSYLPAFVLVILGLFESKFAAKSFVRASQTEFISHVSRRHKFTIRWADVDRIEKSDDKLTFLLRDGSSRAVPTARLWRGDAVSEWIESRAREGGVVLR